MASGAMAQTLFGQGSQLHHQQVLPHRQRILQTPLRLEQLCSRSLPANKAVAVSGYTLRRGEVSDAQQLAKIDAECHQEGSAGWSRPLFHSQLTNTQALTVVAMVQQQVQGQGQHHQYGDHPGTKQPHNTQQAQVASQTSDAQEQPAQHASQVTHEQQDEHSCGSEVVGFATAVVVAGEAQLQNMAVLRQHRGKGLARALLSQMLQEAGCCQAPDGGPCFLEVKSTNTPAIALYTSLGFKVEGRRKGYYEDGTDATLMTRPPQPLA